jgi:hypothetical protein
MGGICPDCDSVFHSGHPVDGYGEVCDSCCENYYTCDDCAVTVHSDDTYGTPDGAVCGDCYDNYCYCDDCDVTYRRGYEDHDHDDPDGGCGCDTFGEQFSVANGNDRLQSDTETVATLPAGIISKAGLAEVVNLIKDAAYNIEDYEPRRQLYDVASLVTDIGDAWQTREGNFTKRLSKAAHKSYGYKFDPEFLGRIGSAARAHVSESSEVAVTFTRHLNAPPRDFAHPDSCWWGSYHESRCALKSNGGYGMRTFDGGNVTGRAWVMPLKRNDKGSLTPTFDTTAPVAYVIFNGYGDLSALLAARIVAGMTGMSYRKIHYSVEPMYINGSTGYLVSDQETLTIEDLRFDLDQHSDLYAQEMTQDVS